MSQNDFEINKITHQIALYFQTIIPKFTENWHDNLRLLSRQLKILEKKLSMNTKRGLRVLGEHGWYISFKMPAVTSAYFGRYPKSIDMRKVDKLMTDYYSSHARQITDSIKQKFPERAKIIEAAYSAHVEKKYELSIPVFLSQADGICYSLINIQLFKKKSRIPRTAEYVGKLTDKYTASLCEPFRVLLPVALDTTDPKYKDGDLNRHAILHGLSLNYASQINSLKAFSLLCYVSEALSEVKDDGIS